MNNAIARLFWTCFQNLDDSASWSCNRTDGVNLVDEWRADHPEKSSVVMNVTQLNGVNAAETDYLLGLFARADLSYDDKRDDTVDPSLPQMVVKAIEVNSREKESKRDYMNDFKISDSEEE